MNLNSGSFAEYDTTELTDHMKDRFAHYGFELQLRSFESGDLKAFIEEAIADGPDALLIAGGDGSVSCAAEIAWKKGFTFAVLPCGTMNLYARTLGIPLELYGAIDAIASGTIQKVDIATANGEPFLHQVSMGFHARTVRLRDQLEFNSRLGKMISSIRTIFAVVLHPPSFPVEITVDGKTEKRTVSAISVSNNLFGDGHLPFANAPNDGKLGIYWADSISVWEAIKVLFDVMRGRWKDNEKITHSEARAVQLHFPKLKRTALAIVDGEKRKLEKTYEFKIHPGELSVLAPKKSDRVDPAHV